MIYVNTTGIGEIGCGIGGIGEIGEIGPVSTEIKMIRNKNSILELSSLCTMRLVNLVRF